MFDSDYASEAERDLIIFTHNDPQLKDDLVQFIQKTKAKNMSLGDIYKTLVSFDRNNNPKENVLDHIIKF